LSEHLSYTVGYTFADSELTADVFQPAGNFYANGIMFEDRVAADGDRLPGTAQNMFNVSLVYDTQFGNGIAMNTVLSGYYQSDMVNSIGDDKCLTVYSAVGNCRDSPSPTSAFYAPDSIYSRNFAEIDAFQIWSLSANFTRDAWGASVYVKNIFNEEGVTGTYTFVAAGSNTLPTQNYYGNNSRDYLALPRTIGAMLTYRF
jgi:hypothetical protein